MLIAGDFNRRNNPLVIDYEHQTLSGGLAPAAGWIKSLMYRGEEGLWAEVEWTPRAKQYLAGCEYRFLSPVFIRRTSDGRVVRLVNAALTNQPAIDGMVPLSDGVCETGEKGVRDPQGVCDPWIRKEESKEMVKEIAVLVGLAEDSTREQVVKEVGRVSLELGRLEGVLNSVRDALGLSASATAPEVEGTVLAMKQASDELAGVRGRLDRSERRVREHEAGELVMAAMKEGKLTPAQRGWATDYAMRDTEAFRVFVAKAPQVVPVAEPGAPVAGTPRAAGLCAVQSHVNRALGLSQEVFEKYSKKEDV